MSKKKLPKVLWTNIVNLSGLYSSTPIRLIARKNEDGDIEHWDETNDVDCECLGVYQKDGFIQFTSKSIHEVELWTMGVVAVMRLLREWSGGRL